LKELEKTKTLIIFHDTKSGSMGDERCADNFFLVSGFASAKNLGYLGFRVTNLAKTISVQGLGDCTAEALRSQRRGSRK